MISRVFIQRFDWRSCVIEVTYEPHWLRRTKAFGERIARLQVRCIAPKGAALPITGSPTFEHFPTVASVLWHGGPLEYARDWLDQAAAWQEVEVTPQQYTLV